MSNQKQVETALRKQQKPHITLIILQYYYNNICEAKILMLVFILFWAQSR